MSNKRPGKEILEKLKESADRSARTYTRFMNEISNPDHILRNTSDGMRRGLELFREIAKDAQVSADLQYRQLKVRSFPFDIQVDSDLDSDQQQARELKKDIEGVYRKLLQEMQDDQVCGFSVTELMWAIADEKVVLADVEGLYQELISFALPEASRSIIDERYTYSSDWLMLLRSIDFNQVEIPRERVVLSSFQATKGNLFGNSLMAIAFWPWWFKKHAWLFWANYIERFAQPTPKGEYPPGTLKEDQQKMLNSLEAIQHDFAVVFPDTWKVELLEAQRSGNLSSYKDFIRYCDRYISKVILMSVLTSNEAEFGTRAQAEVHADLTDEAIEDDALHNQDEMNRQVVRPLASWNYNFTVEPKLVVLYQSEDTSKEAAEKDKIVSETVPVPIKHLNQKYNIPLAEDDDIVTFQGELWLWKNLKQMLEEKTVGAQNFVPQQEMPSYVETQHLASRRNVGATPRGRPNDGSQFAESGTHPNPSGGGESS